MELPSIYQGFVVQHEPDLRRLRGDVFFTTKTKVVVQSTLPTRFTRALPPRGSRDPLRVAEGGTLPYEGARHCPGFSLVSARLLKSGRLTFDGIRRQK